LHHENATSFNWTQTNHTRVRQHSLENGIIYIINQFICLFGLMGNGIVLCFLRFYFKKNPFIIYILSLAVADFAFLLCCLFIIVVFTVECFGSYAFPHNKMMIAAYKAELHLYSCSMYFLTTISTERCFCALYPFWYRCYRPTWLSYAVSAVLWSTVILLCGLDIYSLWEKNLYQGMERAISIANVSFFTPVMILSSLRLFIEVRYCSQYQPGHLCRTILLTVLFFVIFAVPLSIHRLIKYIKLPNFFYLFASINSSINPAIYFLVGVRRDKWLREPLRFIFQRAVDEQDAKEEGNVCMTDTEIITIIETKVNGTE
uniref:G-protein coupled receptors family 1 profile domain-containing protein n=1 Tax=Salvator merianae TaxID=96440 RepID=A0A8D0BLL2_SALMN